MTLTGQAEFIADSKFMALRAELQEQSMLLREILKALQSSGAPATFTTTSAKAEAKAPPKPKVPKEAVGEATVETVQTVDTGKPVPNQREGTGDDAKPYPWGTPQDAPDTGKAEPPTFVTEDDEEVPPIGDTGVYLVPEGKTLKPKADAAKPEAKTEPVQMATRLPSLSEEQGAQPPAVPKRGQTLTGQAETGSTNR